MSSPSVSASTPDSSVAVAPAPASASAPDPAPAPAPAPAPGRRRARRRSRALLLVALVALLGLVGAACDQLDPDNRAASVPGVTNGNLPMRYLASTSSGCVVYDEALASLNAMVAAAAKDGITLRPTSCYRDYAGQVSVRADWCSRGACHMAAVPGTSNHGWGKAVDFADRSGTLTFESEAYAWMKQWAWAWGWIHPATMEPTGPVPEPWHWEWIGDGGKMFLGEYFGVGNAPLAEPRGLPFGALDVVSAGPGTLTVDGWAIDPDQVASIPVHIYIDGAMLQVMANRARPDVAAAYPYYAGANHGYQATFGVAPGPHEVCVYAINASGTGFNRLIRCATVTVPPTSAPAVVAPPTTAPVTPPTTSAPVPTTAAPASSTTSTTVAGGEPAQGISPATR